MKTPQKGFTLIELIVVIVILGILSATALPKFIDMGQDARGAVVQAVEGSMRSANSMIYAKAATAGALTGVSTVSITGAGSVGTTNGFATDAKELVKAMDIDTKKIDGTTAGGVFYTGYATTTCGVAYTAAAAGGAPTYTTVVTGC